jgi:rare lipoprotein A
MRSVIDLTALGTLALIAVTLTPTTANARSPHTEIGANPRAATGMGPERDYPLVVGEAFTVDGKTYVPSDTMNYDAVGYAESGEGGDVVTGAHRTLPLPSYAEVTSLSSGKTILVRLTKRGPMAGTNLVALSPGAWAQLGLGEGAKAPVRVRRVNPPESERAMLRLGQHAPDRMETPPGLLGVLKRKLGEGNVALLSESAKGAAASAMAPLPVVVKPSNRHLSMPSQPNRLPQARRSHCPGQQHPGLQRSHPLPPSPRFRPRLCQMHQRWRSSRSSQS